MVTVDSTYSEHLTPSSGVPQGAVLSPFLFALFVNSEKVCPTKEKYKDIC